MDRNKEHKKIIGGTCICCGKVFIKGIEGDNEEHCLRCLAEEENLIENIDHDYDECE
jgi:hypothetical protein